MQSMPITKPLIFCTNICN